jgi:Peptidase A4 family
VISPSGYAVTGAAGSVTDVKGSWVVPAVQGSRPSTNQYASFWVGIDGFSSNTVEQIGTDSDCQNGAPTNYAWFEFYPHPFTSAEMTLPGLTGNPLSMNARPLGTRSGRRLNGLRKPHQARAAFCRTLLAPQTRQ